MTIVAWLTVRRDQLAAFHAYERAAAAIMAHHGAAIERVIVLDGDGDHREIHVVTAPSPAAWAAYRTDPRSPRSPPSAPPRSCPPSYGAAPTQS